MKRLACLLLAILMITLSFAGCGNKKERLNYKKGLDDYVELCDLNSITVDCNSEDYKNIEQQLLSQDLNAYTVEIKDGKVQKGDIANIDYLGKVDGVAFEGGEDKGYDLTIGSGAFIDGFEDQLIGVEVGKTVDINVTFPTDYQATDLAGKKAVFTVTINKIARPYSEVNDEFAKAAGYENAEAYNKYLKEESVKNFVYSYIINNSKVKELPPDKDGNNYEYHKKYYTDLATSYGVTFEVLLSNYQLDEEGFKKEVLNDEIISYAVFDKLGLALKKEAIVAKGEEIAKLNSTTYEEMKSTYGENFMEFIYVNNIITEELVKKVNIIDKK